MKKIKISSTGTLFWYKHIAYMTYLKVFDSSFRKPLSKESYQMWQTS